MPINLFSVGLHEGLAA